MQIHVLVLHQGYGFQAARNNRAHTVLGNLLGGGGNSHQAGGALTINGHTRHGHRQARAQGNLTRDVGAGGSLLQGTAQNAIVDIGRVNTRAFDGFCD
jgi:hypothetical protein